MDTLSQKALGDSVPVWLFGTVSLVGGVLTLVLPETKDTKIPDTLKVMAAMEKYDSYLEKKRHPCN